MLLIFELYGVGPNVWHVVCIFWQGLEVVLQQSGYYGQPIPSDRGVTQGDILLPTAFNIIVDAMVHCCRTTTSVETGHNLFFARPAQMLRRYRKAWSD
jgi:hypothetical protein